MNDYSGKICPYCKTEFRQDDDIVVCSACDMPHHKDCWVENQGCTTFGCLGTIKAVDSTSSTVTATRMDYDENQSSDTANSSFVFCTKCGTKNDSTSTFCFNCRTALVRENIDHTPINNYNVNQGYQTQNNYGYNANQGYQAQNNYGYNANQGYQTQNNYGYNANQGYQTQNNYGYNANQGYQTQNNYGYNANQSYQAQNNYGYNANQSYQAQNNYGYNANQGYQNQGNYGYGNNQTYQTSSLDSDLPQLIVEKTEYYMPKFQKMKTEGTNASWNWAAFFVTPYWMIYRKMYGWGISILVADIILTLIGFNVLSILSLAAYICFGIFGNNIYLKHLEGKANQAKLLSEPYKSQFILNNGGVNTLATVLAIIGRMIIVGSFML